MACTQRARWVHAIGLDYALALDGLSLPLVLMNGVLCLVAANASRRIENRPRVYFALLLVISGAVNGAFLAQNLLLFFPFYELELIPLWMLIAVWGGANPGLRRHEVSDRHRRLRRADPGCLPWHCSGHRNHGLQSAADSFR